MCLQQILAFFLIGIVSQSLATFYQICERPADPANGNVVDRFGGVGYFEPDDKVWFRCDDGFNLEGAKDFVCQRDGNWQPQPFPRCVRRVQQCRRPDDPRNGDVVSRKKNQRLFDTVEKVWFKCNNGFDLDGAKDFVCQRNGNWQPQPFPTCVRRHQQCRRPDNPRNGDIVSRKRNERLFEPGQKIWFKCDKGFDLDGAKDFVCQRDGNWKPQPFPKCVRRDQRCRRPDEPRNGDIWSRKRNQKLFDAGDKIRFKCDKGYDLDGKRELVCQRDGNWKPQTFPKCVRIKKCKLPNKPKNGGIWRRKKNQRFFDAGDKIKFKCDKGYDLDGEKDFFICQRDGDWKPQRFPTCVREQRCSRPDKPKNGWIWTRKKNQKSFKPGEKIRFKCNRRYDLKGKREFVCQKNGRWQPQPFPKCVR